MKHIVIEKDQAVILEDKELKELANIYKQLQEPKRSIIVMGANLLLASQNAESTSKCK